MTAFHSFPPSLRSGVSLPFPLRPYATPFVHFGHSVSSLVMLSPPFGHGAGTGTEPLVLSLHLPRYLVRFRSFLTSSHSFPTVVCPSPRSSPRTSSGREWNEREERNRAERGDRRGKGSLTLRSLFAHSGLMSFAPQGGVSEASASRSSHPFRRSSGRNGTSERKREREVSERPASQSPPVATVCLRHPVTTVDD